MDFNQILHSLILIIFSRKSTVVGYDAMPAALLFETVMTKSDCFGIDYHQKYSGMSFFRHGWRDCHLFFNRLPSLWKDGKIVNRKVQGKPQSQTAVTT